MPELLLAPEITDAQIDHLVVTLRPLADWWSNKIQWCEDDHEDLVQEGLLELVKTLRSYQRSGKQIDDIKSLASTCFSAAMKWWYKKNDRNLFFDSYHTQHIEVDNMDVFFSAIYIDCYLEELGRVHGALARLVVLNLISAADESVGDLARPYTEEKEVRKKAGERVVGHSAVRPQKQFIRQALGMDTNEWDRTMATIKSFTLEYMCREARNTVGPTTKASSGRPPRSGYHTAASTTHSLHSD